MPTTTSRSDLPRQSSLGAAAAVPVELCSASATAIENAPQAEPLGRKGAPRFQISLGAWSLHGAIRSAKMRLLDLPRVAREEFEIGAIELVNTLFEAPTAAYLELLRRSARERGVRILLILCDDEGQLGHADAEHRRWAVRNHHKWIDIAAELGCHSIRVNLRGDGIDAPGVPERTLAFIEHSAASLHELLEYAAPRKVGVLVENHGGRSSDPAVLEAIARQVDSDSFGLLPDFGNFPAAIDRYEAVARMMPFARAVSAKCHDFDEAGDETSIDYARMLSIVCDEGGYHGYIGIEYEGSRLEEIAGILACKRLLERLRH